MVQPGDDALVVAESLGELAPLNMERAMSPGHVRVEAPRKGKGAREGKVARA